MVFHYILYCVKCHRAAISVGLHKHCHLCISQNQPKPELQPQFTLHPMWVLDIKATCGQRGNSACATLKFNLIYLHWQDGVHLSQAFPKSSPQPVKTTGSINWPSPENTGYAPSYRHLMQNAAKAEEVAGTRTIIFPSAAIFHLDDFPICKQ